MGKNTDKLYITQSEHSGVDGRHGSSTGITHKRLSTTYRRLPYIFCALTLQPWEHPVCAINARNEAMIFDLLAIVPWLQKKSKNPVNGEALEAKDLLKLHFHKNDQDEYCDPVTLKVFNDHTHLVAIKASGNVFAFETIENLNFKPKNWKDLISDTPFTRSDIIVIQDPHNLGQNHNIDSFVHLKEKSGEAKQFRKASILPADSDAKRDKIEAAKAALNRMRTVSDKKKGHSEQRPVSEDTASASTRPHNAANYSTGYTAASFTSTGLTVSTKDDRALLSEVEYLLHPKKIKIKGLGVINTNHGPLDIELFPEHAPKAVYNFVKLAKSGYYNGLSFHRNIPTFMLQGGDPTGRGNGGKSIFDKEFDDEISPTQSHDRRGILSMANKGPNTNTSQFFITYDSAKHLDKKHTIFGHVIGHNETLDILERMPRDGDKPKEPILMTEVQILLDPFEEHLKKEDFRRQAANAKKEITEDDLQTWTNKPVNKIPTREQLSNGISSIGKYMTTDSVSETVSGQSAELSNLEGDSAPPPLKKVKLQGFGNFSGW